MDKVTISVYSIVGNHFCVGSDDGEKVYNQIVKAIENDKKVELSFQNIDMLTSAFLNTAIGKLYGTYEQTIIKKYLSVTDISDDDKILLKRVVETAKSYYEDPEKFERSVKAIMEE